MMITLIYQFCFLFRILKMPAYCIGLCVLLISPIVHAQEIYLDIQSVANRLFVDPKAGDGKGGWSDQGPENSLRQIPRGRYVYKDFVFQIPPKNNANKPEVLVFNSSANHDQVKWAASIKVDSKLKGDARSLTLLHTLCWTRGSMMGKTIGTMKLHYADGSVIARPLKMGQHVSDWWKASRLPNAVVGYEENNGSTHVGLYMTVLDFPAGRGWPRRVEFSNGNKAMWIVVAATLSGQKRSMPPSEKPFVVQANDKWKPYNQDNFIVKSGSALDFSFLNDQEPAGALGFTTINKKGQLVFEKQPQTPLRLFSCSIGMPTFTYKTPQEITAFAQQIAMAGYNVVRPHFLDGFLMLNTKNDFEFNPENMKIFDLFVSELSKRGVYIYLDATTSWSMYKAMNLWTPKAKKQHLKVRSYFEPEAQEHWKKGVKKLLEHVNPYTGLAYKDSPQVLAVQLRNEAGLYFQMVVSGKKSSIRPLIQSHFQKWLKSKYQTRDKLRQAWTWDNNKSKPSCDLPAGVDFNQITIPEIYRVSPSSRDLMAFFTDVEQKTYSWMSQYLRDLGVRVPLNDYNNGYAMQTIISRDGVDFIDGHAYHNHPSKYMAPGSTMKCNSLLGTEVGSYRNLVSIRANGKPYVCTEWGSPFWSPYRHEAQLAMPAYASMQQWQLLSQHSTPVGLFKNAATSGPMKAFKVHKDPICKSGEYITALLFRRGDVQAAKHLVDVQLDVNKVFRSQSPQYAIPSHLTRLSLLTKFGVSIKGTDFSSQYAPYESDLQLDAQGGMVLQAMRGAEIVIDNRTASNEAIFEKYVSQLRSQGVLSKANRTDPARGVYESETGEIYLDSQKEILQVNTPKSLGMVITSAQGQMQVGVMAVRTQVNAMVYLGSLDQENIPLSKRMLLIINTDALNSGMEFDAENRRVLRKLGNFPVLMRTGKFEITLQHQHAALLKLYALATDGSRKQKIPLIQQGDKVTAMIDTASLTAGPTPYFEWVTSDDK